jgi:hypothetical protein
MIRFGDRSDSLEITFASLETVDLPSRGDRHMTVRVCSAGFTGHSGLWVAAAEFRQFCSALIVLERDRQGEARLLSISPNELNLQIRSVDRKGHMAVQGAIGHHVRRENSLQWHAVHFGFEFEPWQLNDAVKSEWIRSHE